MKLLSTAAVLAVVGMTGCSATSIVSTWKKPGVGAVSFNKVVVIVGTKEAAMRRMAEDRLSHALKIPAVASHTLVPEEASDEELRATILAGGFDGTIVLRVTSVEKE